MTALEAFTTALDARNLYIRSAEFHLSSGEHNKVTLELMLDSKAAAKLAAEVQAHTTKYAIPRIVTITC